MRTTLDIDDPILRQLKALQRREKKSLGRLVSDLLAQALRAQDEPAKPTELDWTVKEMGARYDLADSSALRDAMDDRKGSSS